MDFWPFFRGLEHEKLFQIGQKNRSGGSHGMKDGGFWWVRSCTGYETILFQLCPHFFGGYTFLLYKEKVIYMFHSYEKGWEGILISERVAAKTFLNFWTKRGCNFLTYLSFSESSEDRGPLKKRTVVQMSSSPYIPTFHSIPFPRWKLDITDAFFEIAKTTLNISDGNPPFLICFALEGSSLTLL